jgi:integrase
MPEDYRSKRITVYVLHRSDSPYLLLQWLDPGTGKRKSKSAETCNPAEAEKRRADLEYELNNGLYSEPSRMTWAAFRELFEAEYVAGQRRDTRHNYKMALSAFERLCGPRQLGSVSERTVSAFVAALRREPGVSRGSLMQPSTVKVRVQFLHTALAWAVRQRMLPAVPRVPSVKVPKRKPQPVAAEAFERLLAKAPDLQTRVFLLCGWLAGLRLNEALTLEWEESHEAPWVDLARDRIWLPAGFVKAVEDQWVPLDAALREALLALPRQGRKVFRFVEERSGKPVGDDAVGSRVAKLAKAAGVRMTFKTLRQGFGCHYAAQVSAHVLQRLMRHSNIKITMDYYANVDAAVEDAVRRARRNTSHNSRPAVGPEALSPDSASPDDGGASG